MKYPQYRIDPSKSSRRKGRAKKEILGSCRVWASCKRGTNLPHWTFTTQGSKAQDLAYEEGVTSTGNDPESLAVKARAIYKTSYGGF